jgi:hypothetical protein
MLAFIVRITALFLLVIITTLYRSDILDKSQMSLVYVALIIVSGMLIALGIYLYLRRKDEEFLESYLSNFYSAARMKC